MIDEILLSDEDFTIHLLVVVKQELADTHFRTHDWSINHRKKLSKKFELVKSVGHYEVSLSPFTGFSTKDHSR